MKLPYYSLFVLSLVVSIFGFSSCQSNEGGVNEFPFNRFSNFENCPDVNDTKELAIPFYQNGLYGLSDYDGNLILTPRYRNIEMITFSFPYFWANEKGQWYLYDLEGNQVVGKDGLPFPKTRSKSVSKIYPSENYQVLFFNIPVQRDASSQNSEDQFLFLSEFMKPPFSLYKMAKREKEDPRYPGSLKVKTLDGLYTCINEKGEELFEPVVNCKLMENGYVKVADESGKYALWNYKENWKTNFKFSGFLETKNKNIFLGKTNAENKYYDHVIYGKGSLKLLNKEEKWKVMNNEYSIYAKIINAKPKYILWDNLKFESIKEVDSNKYYKFPGGKIGLELDDKRVETVAGEIKSKPVSNDYLSINNHLSSYKVGKETVLVDNQSGKKVVSFVGNVLRGKSKKCLRIKSNENKYGVLNSKGNLILELAYDDIPEIVEEDEYIFAQKDGIFRIYNLEGNPINDFQFKKVNKVSIPNMTSCDTKFQDLIRVFTDSTDYIITKNLLIVSENNSYNPVIDKSDFVLSMDNPLAREDFKGCEFPKILTEYVIFKGQRFVHIFRMDGKFISSIEAKFIKMEQLLKTSDNSLKPLTHAVFAGIIQMESEGVKFWLRASDGLEYRKN